MTESAQPAARSEVSRVPVTLSDGLRYSLKNFGAILGIAFFPGVLRVGASAIQSLYPIRPNGLFLIFFVAALSFAWQLTATASLLVARLRGKAIRLGEHIAAGFTDMPKVLISHATILGIVFFSYLIALGTGEVNPALRGILATSFVVGFFLTWAPAFVAGENFSQVLIEDDDEDDEFDPFEDEALLPRSRRFQRVFSGMGVLDLGIERSFQFTMRHFNLTMALVLLTWCAKIFPAAIAAGLFRSSTEIPAIVCESALSTVLLGLLLSSTGYVFLQILPREARDELSLPDRMPEKVAGRRSPVLSRVVLTVLLMLSIIATMFLFGVLRTEQTFPAELRPTVLAIERKGDVVTLRFDLNDAENSYRWLDLERFRLEVKKIEQPQAPPPEGDASAQPKKGGLLEYLEENFAQGPSVTLIAPSQYLLYSEDGKLLDERYFKPYNGKLRIELSFDLEHIPAVEPRLVYLTLDQSAEPVSPLRIPEAAPVPEKPAAEDNNSAVEVKPVPL